MRITFLFDNYSNSSKREFYESVRDLKPNDSIRKASMSVINEAVKHGVAVYNNGVHGDDGIAIYISSSKIKDAETGHDKSGFGIRYSLRKNGEIIMLHGYEALRHDWTLSELQSIVSNGYVEGNATKLVVARPIGLGAAPQDVFDWLGFIANILQVIGTMGAGARLLRSAKIYIINRRVRQTVSRWQENGIRYPSDLRNFIDTKGAWTLTEVKKRLKLNDEFAIKLLASLGLEPVGNEWRLTHSKESIANRRQWLNGEKRYTRAQGVKK